MPATRKNPTEAPKRYPSVPQDWQRRDANKRNAKDAKSAPKSEGGKDK